MITAKMRKFLESVKLDRVENKRKYNIYMRRIQDRIDRELENLNWLTKNFPDLFLDEECEYDDKSLERHRRLKALLKAVGNLNPKFAVELRIVEEDLESLKPPSWWREEAEKRR